MTDQCWWCGFRGGKHDPRCDVPARLEQLARAAARPPAGPSSLELFQDAQRAGTTIGHQWVQDLERSA